MLSRDSRACNCQAWCPFDDSRHAIILRTDQLLAARVSSLRIPENILRQLFWQAA